MKKMMFSLAIVSSFVLIGGCNATKKINQETASVSEGSEALYSSRWELSALEAGTALSGKTPYLGFFPGKVTALKGNTGCNNLSGSVELMANNKIKFSPLAVTKMACAGDNVEAAFLDAISKADSWKIVSNELSLLSGTTVVARFAAKNMENDAKNTAALGGRWQLNYISGSRIAFDGLFPKEKPFVVFNVKDSALGGNTSCNSFSSKMVMNGNKITLANPLQTMMYCEGGGEKAFTNMLVKTTGYAVSADGKTLNFLMDDVATMRFEKMAEN